MNELGTAALACDLSRVAAGAAALHLQYVARLLEERRVIEASAELGRISQQLAQVKSLLHQANELFARDSPDNT